MSQADEEYWQKIGAEFRSADEKRRWAMIKEFQEGKRENEIWKYFNSFHRFWKYGGDLAYNKDRCLNDLALLTILGHEQIDPWDQISGLAYVLDRADAMDHTQVWECYQEVADIARRLNFQQLAKIAEDYPFRVWNSDTYRARRLKQNSP